MCRILFIGGAGFIGSAVIHSILKRNPDAELSVVEPHHANLSRLSDINIDIFEGELNDIELIKTVILQKKINTIIHLVSTLIPGSGFEDYKIEIQNIVFPTMRLTQLCSELGITFVFFSSGGTVYGNRQDPKPFEESDEREPISYYGLTKLMIENNILFEHRTQGLKYLILRPSNPYGHGQPLRGRQGFIAVALGCFFDKKPVEIWGDGSSIRDYIYIDDLADSVSKLLEKKITNDIINIGSNQGYSNKKIVEIIKKVVEGSFSIDYKPSRLVDVSTMILSNKKLKSYINIDFIPIEEGIRLFYEEESRKVKLTHK